MSSIVIAGDTSGSITIADVTVTSGTSVVFATGVALDTRVDLVYPT